MVHFPSENYLVLQDTVLTSIERSHGTRDSKENIYNLLGFEQLSKFERGRIIGRQVGRMARHKGRSDAAARRCRQEWVNHGVLQRHDGRTH
ncbi:hypothetical protein TNCV_1795831 [Trichonephila clavipes]|nr:hypothetical protein TNCV_1795831 [Trichonephila clavipes]